MEQTVVCCDDQLRNATLLDLSLPGTHDSMTYDLSDTLSDGYEGMGPVISWILQLGTCSSQTLLFQNVYSYSTTVGRGVEQLWALQFFCVKYLECRYGFCQFQGTASLHWLADVLFASKDKHKESVSQILVSIAVGLLGVGHERCILK